MTHASWTAILHDLVMTQTDGAPAGNGEAAPPSGLLGNPIWLLVIMVLIMYFLLIAPQRRRDRERREMLGALRKGDKVVTSGGICGTILKVSDTKVLLRVNDDPAGKIEFVREAIARVEPRDTKDKDASKDADAPGDDDSHDEDAEQK